MRSLDGRVATGEKVMALVNDFVDRRNPPDRVLATMF
jgi:hypothetical protein